MQHFEICILLFQTARKLIWNRKTFLLRHSYCDAWIQFKNNFDKEVFRNLTGGPARRPMPSILGKWLEFCLPRFGRLWSWFRDVIRARRLVCRRRFVAWSETRRPISACGRRTSDPPRRTWRRCICWNWCVDRVGDANCTILSVTSSILELSGNTPSIVFVAII